MSNADRSMVARAAEDIISAVIGGLIIWAAIKYIEELPSLYQVGEPQSIKNGIKISLRTKSVIPVVVQEYRFQIKYPVSVEAAITKEESLVINEGMTEPSKWYIVKGPKFQVKRDDVTSIPISIEPQRSGKVLLDVEIFYGDAPDYKVFQAYNLDVILEKDDHPAPPRRRPRRPIIRES